MNRARKFAPLYFPSVLLRYPFHYQLRCARQQKWHNYVKIVFACIMQAGRNATHKEDETLAPTSTASLDSLAAPSIMSSTFVVHQLSISIFHLLAICTNDAYTSPKEQQKKNPFFHFPRLLQESNVAAKRSLMVT